jgi:hypothetical protein
VLQEINLTEEVALIVIESAQSLADHMTVREERREIVDCIKCFRFDTMNNETTTIRRYWGDYCDCNYHCSMSAGRSLFDCMHSLHAPSLLISYVYIYLLLLAYAPIDL